MVAQYQENKLTWFLSFSLFTNTWNTSVIWGSRTITTFSERHSKHFPSSDHKVIPLQRTFTRWILLGQRMKPPSPSSPQTEQGKNPKQFNISPVHVGLILKKHLRQGTWSPGSSCCVEQTDSSRMPFPLGAPCKMPTCCDRYSQGRQTEASCTGSPWD